VDISAPKLYVWDGPSAKRVFTNTVTSPGTVSLSPDGKWVAWVDGSLHIANIAANTVSTVSGTFAGRVGAQFSADDHYLTFAGNISGSFQVYVRDLTAGTNGLISHAYNSSSAASGTSDTPIISPDGRYIAYRTFATNTVPIDANEVGDLMLYDRSNAVSLLITASSYGNRTANNRSTPPVFSADGKNVSFATWANDLLANDFNPGSDVYLLSLPGSSVPGVTNSGAAGTPVAGLQIFPLTGPSATPTFTWPAQYGASYQVQYKNDLGDPLWHNLTGNAGVAGNLGEAFDLNPSVSNRFYHVILGN
jgi:Tol biopolymer transport system component